MRPFFPYYGSMWNRARYYPVPQHDLVKEPFAGAAGYSLFYDCRRVDLFDVDPIVCGVWHYLLNADPAEVMALPDMPEVGDSVDNYALPQEAKWLIGFWLNRGSAQPKKTRTAYSARTDRAQLNWGPRAKERIVAQLPMIQEGWTITEGSYERAENEAATWLIDPPYQDKGRFYRFPLREFGHLATWARARSGLVIVCEQAGADWLPFVPLGSFKSTRGRSAEMAFVSGDATDLFAESVAHLEPCSECNDSGFVETFGGGIWTGESVTSRLRHCDCICGQDAKRSPHAPERRG